MSLYGGISKFEQFKALKKGVDVIVATPGRLIDIIRMKGVCVRVCVKCCVCVCVCVCVFCWLMFETLSTHLLLGCAEPRDLPGA